MIRKTIATILTLALGINTLGLVLATADVDITVDIAKPSNLIATNDIDKVVLTWDGSVSEGGNSIFYRIDYKKSDLSVWKFIETADPAIHTMDIAIGTDANDLIDGELFDFKVSAYIEGGDLFISDDTIANFLIANQMAHTLGFDEYLAIVSNTESLESDIQDIYDEIIGANPKGFTESEIQILVTATANNPTTPVDILTDIYNEITGDNKLNFTEEGIHEILTIIAGNPTTPNETIIEILTNNPADTEIIDSVLSNILGDTTDVDDIWNKLVDLGLADPVIKTLIKSKENVPAWVLALLDPPAEEPTTSSSGGGGGGNTPVVSSPEPATPEEPVTPPVSSTPAEEPATPEELVTPPVSSTPAEEPTTPEITPDPVEDTSSGEATTEPVVEEEDTETELLAGGSIDTVAKTTTFDGDANNNGIPDYWEKQYFPNEEVNADADPDEDGLSNYAEYTLGTNPISSDTDLDGLNDGDEVEKHTNPLITDTDGDGLNDGDEVILLTDPLVADTDGDSFSDGNEVDSDTDPLDPDSYPSDSDGDGVADVWEIKYFGDISFNDYGDRDFDGDGLSDRTEYKNNTNPLLMDTDGDGYSDSQEILDYGTDPRNPDSKPIENSETKILNIVDNAEIYNQNLVFRGTAPADSNVTIIAIQDGMKFTLGTEKADSEGKFIVFSDTKIANGQYAITAVSMDDSGNLISQSKNIQVTLIEPITDGDIAIESFGDQVVAEGFLEIEDGIVFDTPRPVVSGRTEYGAEVEIVWHSIITSSSLIVDSEIGRFSNSPEYDLPLGEHELVITAKKEGKVFAAKHINFTITKPNNLTASISNMDFNSLFILILLLLGGLSTAMILHHKKRKTENVFSKINQAKKKDLKV